MQSEDSVPTGQANVVPPASPAVAPLPTSSAVSSSGVNAASALTSVIYEGHYPTSATFTQEGPEGIRFDFNEGARVMLPERSAGTWRVRLTDADTENVLFQYEAKGMQLKSVKRFYVRFRIEVWALEGGAKDPPRLVMDHVMDLADRDVLIHNPPGTVGDSFAWFSYADVFAKKHPKARITVCLSPHIIPLVKSSHPHLNLVTEDELKAGTQLTSLYASYSMGVFFADTACNHQPIDFRHVGLHRTAAYILGVEPIDAPPKLALVDESRPMKARYVCIAVQATSAAKQWNNPSGWREVVKFLKDSGYEVVCIDQKPEHGVGLRWTHIPHGTVDKTGATLSEAARYLRHCEFMVGLSSGLSWLAWAAGAKVVLIRGFSLPSTEFDTPYRVINWHTCNGCWNDPTLRFENQNFLWCPRHANTPRQFECTTQITGAQVIRMIKSVKGFRAIQPKAVAESA